MASRVLVLITPGDLPDSSGETKTLQSDWWFLKEEEAELEKT